MTRLYRLSLICALIPSCAWAQEQDDIVVTATRTETPVSQVGLSVSVIDASDIERLQARTVPELLRTVPGLATARSGGVGTFSSVFVRGASADHSVALIDGIKINDPSSTAGGYDFGRLTTGAIDRVEIVRGPQSVLWGSQAIGGVVNLITRKAEDGTSSATFQGEYGYRDTVDLIANGAATFGPVAVSGGASWLRTDGISAFSEGRGAIERDGAEEYGANLNLSVEITPSLSVDLRGWYAHSAIDLDGYLPDFSFGDTAEYNRTKEAIGYAGLNWALLDGRLKNRIAYAITDIRRKDHNPAATPRLQNNALGRNQRVEYQGVFDITDGWNLVFGAERERARFRIVADYGFGATADRGTSKLTSFYGQLNATPVVGLSTALGVRHDDHDRFGGHTTFAANAAYTPNDGNTVLRVSYGEGFKAPSLYQLHSGYGNPNLAPETARSWDIGVSQSALDGAAEVSVTWFRRKTRNLIDLIPCAGLGNPSPVCVSPFSYTYENVANARAKGVETALRLRPVEPLLVDFNYSYSKSEDLSIGRDLARRPRHKVYASIDYQWPFGLSTGASVTHVGASYDSPYSNVRNADYVLTDIRASLPLSGRIEIYARIENLFDAQYETVATYGQPGRAGYAGLRLKI